MRFILDPDRSVLAIHASSTVHPIDTETRVEGWFEAGLAGGRIDPGTPFGGALTVPLTHMQSGNALIDRETERRLSVRSYPTIEGELVSLEPLSNDGAGPDRSRFQAEGSLTFHGVTRPLSGELVIEVVDTGSTEELILTGSVTIDVTDFGVQPPSLLLIKVHKHITVDLHAVAVHAGTD